MPRKKSTTTAIRCDEITMIPADLNKITKKREEVKENRIRQSILAKLQCDLFDSKKEVGVLREENRKLQAEMEAKDREREKSINELKEAEHLGEENRHLRMEIEQNKGVLSSAQSEIQKLKESIIDLQEENKLNKDQIRNEQKKSSKLQREVFQWKERFNIADDSNRLGSDLITGQKNRIYQLKKEAEKNKRQMYILRNYVTELKRKNDIFHTANNRIYQ